MLAGNAVECRTLEGMLKDLDAPDGALIVMDRGIAQMIATIRNVTAHPNMVFSSWG